MKTFLSILLLLPGLSFAQPDSLAPVQSVIPSRSPSDTLKPVEFREIPYNYYVRGASHTGLNRIYTYDGIDVPDPEKTLWPTLLASNDPDVLRLRDEYSTIRTKKTTSIVVGTLLLVPGLVAAAVGRQQNREWQYNNQLINAHSQSAVSASTLSDGSGLMIPGFTAMLVGTIVLCVRHGDRSGTFLRAVQYYNRALKQPVSWQLLPYSSFGTAGPSIVVRF